MPYAGLLYTVVVWAAAFVVVKAALAGLHPLALVGWRFALAAACLAPFAWRARGLRRALKPGVALGALLVALYVPHTMGLRSTSVTNSGFLTGAFILFVPVFTILFERRFPHPGQWAAALLALAGVWLVTGGVSRIGPGDLLTVGSTVAYAAHLFATDRWVRATGDVLALAFHQLWVVGAVCLGAAAVGGVPLLPSDAPTVRALVFLALLPTLSASLVQAAAQRTLPPLTVSLVFSLEPLAAGLFAWTLGGEAFRAEAALGGVLIVAAIALGEACAAARPAPQEGPIRS